ncbi:MAG: hypothetical protein GC190_21255 [Alphaproteobacteria bacterium]|nr:hypothetical protein [Alphaproteobacteria bacterium]
MSQRSLAQAVGLCLTGTSLLFLSPVALAAPAPNGSYQQTCRDITARHERLSAECRTRSGNWINTTLDDYRDCSGDISNQNGNLTCGGRDDNDRNADDNGGDNDHMARPPQGSYRDSCRNVHVDDEDLVAECRTWDGEWHRTTLEDYRRCGGHIRNNNGRLRCERGGRDDSDHHGGEWRPRGSYQETCHRIRVDDGDLSAYCRMRSGDWRQTDLENVRDCRGDISNDNGRLARDRGGRRGRITLYRHARFGGRSRTYTDDQPWLGDFADMASSADVQGGRWQLCTRRHYRGRCVTIDSDVRNFNSLGINDRVESLRRAR